jgi:glucose-1-phosphate thymidylyltransferase
MNQTKQLLPVFNRELILYPVSTLVSLGVKSILVICKPEYRDSVDQVLANNLHPDVSLDYAVQAEPRGIAEALLIGRDFLDGESCALILGDNIFHGLDFDAAKELDPKGNAVGFAKKVSHPERYGVVEVNAQGKAVSIEEKPHAPKSELALTGLYILPPDCCAFAEGLLPSGRGELEITDLLGKYLAQDRLITRILGPSVAWFDAGTFEDLLDAGNYVRIVEGRTSSEFGTIPFLRNPTRNH